MKTNIPIFRYTLLHRKANVTWNEYWKQINIIKYIVLLKGDLNSTKFWITKLLNFDPREPAEVSDPVFQGEYSTFKNKRVVLVQTFNIIQLGNVTLLPNSWKNILAHIHYWTTGTVTSLHKKLHPPIFILRQDHLLAIFDIWSIFACFGSYCLWMQSCTVCLYTNFCVKKPINCCQMLLDSSFWYIIAISDFVMPGSNINILIHAIVVFHLVWMSNKLILF